MSWCQVQRALIVGTFFEVGESSLHSNKIANKFSIDVCGCSVVDVLGHREGDKEGWLNMLSQ